jgi:hypothetical protein
MNLGTPAGLGPALFAALMLGGCVSGGSGGAGLFSSKPAATMQTVTNADGTEQFSVPSDGRAAVQAKLAQVVTEPIQEARISNAWRTAASARVTPNDYATCVSATTASGTRNFVMIVSNGGIGDVISGSAARTRCADAARVVQWVAFTEVVASR